MLASLSVSALGLLMLVLFAVFYYLGIFSATRAILAFAGTCLIGTAGFAGGLVTDVARWVTGLLDSASGWAFGVAAGGAIVTVIAGVIFIHDLMPRHTAGKRTGWAGIVLALLLITGVSGFSALNSVPGTVRTGVTSVQSTFGG